MEAINTLEDKVMAMEFAFMCLAKALHQQGALPLPVLQAHLKAAADQLRQDGTSPHPDVGMQPVAGQLEQLRGWLGQLQ